MGYRDHPPRPITAFGRQRAGAFGAVVVIVGVVFVWNCVHRLPSKRIQARDSSAAKPPTRLGSPVGGGVHAQPSGLTERGPPRVKTTDRPPTPNKYLHTFFIGPTIPDKVVVALQSALRLQSGATILLWMEEALVETMNAQLAPVKRRFRCASGATLEVRSLNELERKLRESTDPTVNRRACAVTYATSDRVKQSDLFRFMALFFYGGIYFDADTVFLKDMERESASLATVCSCP